jgi:PcaR/PcaU/PobR family beta-ketoadipate pathway transcriptional regulator
VGSLEKGLRILSAFGRTHSTLTLTQITKASGLDKSAAQRFVFTLTALGFLHKDPGTRTYRLTPRVLSIGYGFLEGDEVVALARPFLSEISQRYGETINLTQLDDTDVVYVARFPGHRSVSVDLQIGTRLPAYCSAPGRVLIAFQPDAEGIIDRSDRVAWTETTITDRSQLLQRLAQIREQGIDVANQETFVGDISIAAPVLDHASHVLAAVNIAVPTTTWSLDHAVAELGPIVQETALKVARAITTPRPLHPEGVRLNGPDPLLRPGFV